MEVHTTTKDILGTPKLFSTPFLRGTSTCPTYSFISTQILQYWVVTMEPRTPLVVLFDKLRKGGKTYYYTLGQYIVAPNNEKTQEISETLEFTPV